MTRAPFVFLDANVLFSMALGGDTFALMLELGRRNRVRYVTSRVCRDEARRNLERKRPDRALDDVLEAIAIADVDPMDYITWARTIVGDTDAHVLAAARTLIAAILVTGDRTHFGAAMERTDLAFRVRTPRAFLIEGPPPG